MLVTNTPRKVSLLKAGASVVALAAALLIVAPIAAPGHFGGPAWAADDGDGGHNDGGGHSGQGGSEGGHGGGGHGAGGQGAGQGQGQPDADSEGRGPKYGQGGGNAGGKPVWAQEGIPEVELGRLNVARSPERVLDQAMAEALSNLTPEMVAYYSQDLDAMIAALKSDFDDQTFIDSPVANLGMLKDVLDGDSELTDYGVVNTPEVLAAVFLGTASDKTVEISPETAYAISAILGYELTEDQAEAMAEDAEAVREAILEGHD